MQGHYGKRLRAQSKLYATVLIFSLTFYLQIMKSLGELLENYLFSLSAEISSKKVVEITCEY